MNKIDRGRKRSIDDIKKRRANQDKVNKKKSVSSKKAPSSKVEKHTEKTTPKKNDKRQEKIQEKAKKLTKVEKKKIKEQKKLEKKQAKLLKKELKEKKINSKKSKKKREIIKKIFSKQGFIIIAIAIIMLLLLATIIFRYTQISDLRYNINDTKRRIEDITKEIKVQKTKIDEASRSDIIEEKATKDLGLTHRNSSQIEYVTVD